MAPLQNRLLSGEMDLHYYGSKLSSYQRRIKEEFLEEDALVFRSYLDHLKAQGMSTGRLYKITWTLFDIKKRLRCSFKGAKRIDIERLVADINGSGYTANTRSDHKKILKKFYKFVIYGNADRMTPFPPEVVWIDTSIKKNELREPEVISEEEAIRMISAATSSREKALVAVAYEGGFRIGELLGMNIQDVSFDENGARISVHGKTGSRIVRLITSAPVLARYIRDHPSKDGLGPLWVNPPDSRRNACGGMRYQTAREAIQAVAQRAGITKRIHPHLFRHSAATRDASYNISERLLEIKYGWSKGSRMSARYSHIQDVRTVDNALLRVYAGKETKPMEPEFAPLLCPRCGEKNTPGLKYCGRCATPLDPSELTRSSFEFQDLNQLQDALARLNRVVPKPSQEQSESSRDQTA
jgi:integrase/recombinase XerD